MAVFGEDLDKEQAEGAAAEGDGQPTEQPAGSARGLDAANTTRQLAKGAQNLTKGVGGKAVKLVGTIFGPGSKIKIGVIVIDLGVYLLATVLFVIGLTTMSLGNSGTRGTTPEQTPDLTQTEIQNDLKLIACLDSVPPGAPTPSVSDEAETVDDGALLSPECIKLNIENVTKAKAKVAELRIQLKQRSQQASGTAEPLREVGFSLIQAAQAAESQETDPSQSQIVEQASKLLDQIDAELTGISEANGKYKLTKEHSDKLNLLVPQFADVWSKLAFSCSNGAGLVGAALPGKNLYQLKSGPNIIFFYGNASRSNTYATKDMACYLATLTDAARSQLGIEMEVGDISDETGRQAWGPHHQHGGGGNVDIWAPKVMSGDLQGSLFDGDLSVKFAKLIIDLGGQELFITQDQYPTAIKQYSVYAGGHADHWHICISSCN